MDRPPIRIPPVPCVGCRHYDQPEWNCRAFPLGIPDEIRRGEHDHRQPFRGDGGIFFQPIVNRLEIPQPPQGNNPSPGAIQVWLDELLEIRGQDSPSEEFQTRISEHIATARLWLDWAGE